MKSLLLLITAAALAQEAAKPHIATCPMFPADNVWNTPADTLPMDAKSATYIASIGADKPLHPDFGQGGNGIPFMLVPATQKRVKLTYDYREDSDLSRYPVPPDAPIEGGAQSKGDRHVVLVDKDRCVLFELYAAHPQKDGSWHVGSAAIFDLLSNGLRPMDKTSADAAGLPILPGLVRYEEIEDGEIRHALRFTIRQTRKEYIWPARHYASRNTDDKLPPMGMRMRLKADYDISQFSPTNQIILKALKKYGMFLADNGSSVFISGAPSEKWNDEDLHQLTTIHASDFEVVDENEFWFMPNSARVDPLAPSLQKLK